MAKPPEKPKTPPAPSGLRPADFLLDPVPVPDVVESNTDTAWGLWEHTLQASNEAEAETADHENKDRDLSFEDTVPAGLAELDALKEPPKPQR